MRPGAFIRFRRLWSAGDPAFTAETREKTSPYRLVLEQDSDGTITGTYTSPDGSTGQIDAKLKEDRVGGRWSEPGDEGGFHFWFAGSRDTFGGEYGRGRNKKGRGTWRGRAKAVPPPRSRRSTRRRSRT
jgi:hypothetical protein